MKNRYERNARKHGAFGLRSENRLSEKTPTSRRVGFERYFRYLVILPVVAIIIVFLVMPYANMFITSVKPFLSAGRTGQGITFANYQKALTDPYYLRILGVTMLFGLITTATCLLLGYPIAHHLAQRETQHKGILYAIILSPLLIGAVVRCYGWMLLLADKGLINSFLQFIGLGKAKLMYNFFGVWVGLVHIYLPFMVLSLVGPIQSVDPTWKSAACTLGASGKRIFWRITFPLSIPGIISGSVLVFLLTVSSYIGPILLGSYSVMVTPMLIVQTVLAGVNYPLGAALAFVLVGFVAIVVVLTFRATDKLLKGVDIYEV